MKKPAVLLVAGICVTGITPVDAAEPGWTRHTIWSGPLGADGVHLADVNGDGRMDAASAWEQEGIVTVSLHPGPDGTEPWPTVAVTRRLFAVEDAVIADVDGDGRLDVVSACECRKIVIHFGPDPARILDPAAWSSVTLAASIVSHRWMKVATADIDGDGGLDIVAGGRVGTPATIAWFRAPAPERRRDGTAWSYTRMSEAGWTMSLTPRDVDGDLDVDVVLSDRTFVQHADGTRRHDLRGSRWLENTESGMSWTNHPIAVTGRDMKFLHITDFDGDGDDDVLDGVSAPGYNETFLRRNLGDWLTWETVPIPQPDGVGQYQDVKTVGTNLVFSYSHADGDLSGVVMVAGGQRVEISGPPGTKYDNVELLDVDGDTDLDIVTSEQVDQLGLIWYENPT